MPKGIGYGNQKKRKIASVKTLKVKGLYESEKPGIANIKKVVRGGLLTETRRTAKRHARIVRKTIKKAITPRMKMRK